MPRATKAALYTPTHVTLAPAVTGPSSMVSATCAIDKGSLKMLLVVPVIDEFRIDGYDPS